MTKLLLTVGASGFFFMFAAFAWQGITKPLPYADGFVPVWIGYLVMVLAGWMYTLKMIWERD